MKPISVLIESQIPRFIRMEYPNFVTFIKKYYEWAEQNGQAHEFITNLSDYMDVDRTSLELLDHFASVFLNPLPDIIYERNDIRNLIKNITQHYSAKGTQSSMKFLFRLIEDRDVDFYYPSVDMLRVSDGKFTEYVTIKVIDPPTNIKDWESSEIQGVTTLSRAVIDFINVYETSDGTSVGELFLVSIDPLRPITGFKEGETFTGTTYGGIDFSGVIAPTFADTVIQDGGKYYRNGTRLYPQSGTGSDATMVVDYVSKGSVSSVTIVDGGTGYAVNDKLKFNSAGFGTGAYGRVLTVDGVGAITAVKLNFGGHSYTDMPSIEVESSGGSDAILMAESDDIGHINSTEIRNFGINYVYGDTITIPFMIRIHSQFKPFEIGETVTSPSGTAIILGHDKIGQVMSLEIKTGTILSGETITGDRRNSTAIVYDTSQADILFEGGGVCQYKGVFINNDGKISSNKYIQDSYFYQMFSYLIKTFEEKETWVDHVMPVHPSGTISFGYREIPNRQIEIVSYGGFYGPRIEMTEVYKHDWKLGNTLIKQYAQYVIDVVANISTTDRDKTAHTFGSEITIS